MISITRAIYISFCCLAVRAAPGNVAGGDVQKFNELLNDVSNEAIHHALHNSYAPFQDGVFESDKTAAGALHNEDPSLASRIVEFAHQELVRRQSTNTTTSSTPDMTSSSSPVTPPVTTTPTSTDSITITSSSRTEDASPSAQSSSVDARPTPSSSAGGNIPILGSSAGVTSSSSRAAEVSPTSSISAGDTASSQDVGTSATPSSTGSIVSSSSEPPTTRAPVTPVTSITYTTVTDSAGVQMVISSTITITPPASEGSGAPDATSSSDRPPPELQTGAAHRAAFGASRRDLFGLLGGLTGAMIFF